MLLKIITQSMFSTEVRPVAWKLLHDNILPLTPLVVDLSSVGTLFFLTFLVFLTMTGGWEGKMLCCRGGEKREADLETGE